MFSLLSKESKDHLMVQSLKMTFHSIKTYLAKKDKKNNLTKTLCSQKNYVGLIFSSQIEEYVGAKGNTLVDHKKIKNTIGIKRHKNVKGKIKQIEVIFAHLIKGCRPL